ncbi:MAG TPA: pyridoxal-dependent decarboxylase [Pirellulales bacterium]|jgi:glutamate/tyrosine decarboxylase-like PLP-dependent enzyme|nr:pyridoxal-dependent decarboxylase [Pirellulales bacterium]
MHYSEILAGLRKQFPQPVSDPVHDAYVAFSVLRALDQVDRLKGQSPILGRPVEPDFAAAQGARLVEPGRTLEDVIPELVKHFEGMQIWGHPLSQINVVPPPSIAGILGVLLAAMFNPNLCSEESARGVSAAEERVVAMAADLLGYHPASAGGVFTFGGTGCLMYGVKVGLEKALPGSSRTGVSEPAAVLASDESHYSAVNVAGWLGIGQDHVVRVPTTADNAVCLDKLAVASREVLRERRRIAAIVATMGTTDAFGIDDLAAIRSLRDELVREFALDYRPHIHADAVIGWAWSVFADYDFGNNPLGFAEPTLAALATAADRMRCLPLADSIGIDFHKTGYVPYVSSLALFAAGSDFDLIRRPRNTMPYLFQAGRHHPGTFTLETTRSGLGPMSALANLLLLGKEGLRVLIGHAVEMAQALRREIEGEPALAVLNGRNVGPVTLFRVYPPGVDKETAASREFSDPAFHEEVVRINEFNRAVFRRVWAEATAGRGIAISMTDCYRHSEFGTPIAALKSYVLSPFTDVPQMRDLVRHVLAARDFVVGSSAPPA